MLFFQNCRFSYGSACRCRHSAACCGAKVKIIIPSERNNHDHLLIRELQQLGNLRVLDGYDGKPGWLGTVTVQGDPLAEYDGSAW